METPKTYELEACMAMPALTVCDVDDWKNPRKALSV